MIFRTSNAIKSFFILLLSCQFLASAFSDGALSPETSILEDRAMLQVETLRNPIIYFSEEPSDEGKQRDAGTRIVPEPSMIQQVRDNHVFSAILCLTSKNSCCRQLSFDSHPPLFALHRRRLI